LLANVTSLIPPMDQGVMESLKRRNRRKFVGVLLEKMERGNGLVQAIKTVNIKEVICVIAEAWDEILPTTLSKYETTATADEIRNLQGCEDIQETDVIEWLATDDPAYFNTDLDDNEIILTVTRNAANEPEDTEDSDTEEAFLKVTRSEGKEALETALRFVEQQKESTPADVVLIKKWRDYAASRRRSFLQQRKVTEFFK
jgi:hypothetical protein